MFLLFTLPTFCCTKNKELLTDTDTMIPALTALLILKDLFSEKLSNLLSIVLTTPAFRFISQDTVLLSIALLVLFTLMSSQKLALGRLSV